MSEHAGRRCLLQRGRPRRARCPAGHQVRRPAGPSRPGPPAAAAGAPGRAGRPQAAGGLHPSGVRQDTLLAGWAHGVRWPVAWLSLDAHDNDPARFWVTWSRPWIGCVPASASPSWRCSPARPSGEAVVTALVNEVAALPDQLGLVLDDYRVMESQQVHQAVTFLLAHLPPQLHVVIASRTDPPPLARLRARPPGHTPAPRACWWPPATTRSCSGVMWPTIRRRSASRPGARAATSSPRPPGRLEASCWTGGGRVDVARASALPRAVRRRHPGRRP